MGEKAIVPELKLTEEKLYFYGNEQMMHRILQNIIKNVLEHGEKKVEICLNSIKNEIRLTIQNEVTKPDEIDISRIFERFYKAEVARSKTSTGLGMAIAKEMTEDMGGKIEAELNDNIFKVSLFFKRL
ncbi:MAG: sensor histidine kinase [Butyribacter sp.]